MTINKLLYQDIGKIGHWINDIEENSVFWSDHIFEIFDSLPAYARLLQKNLKPMFEQAVFLYRKGEMERAKKIFQHCLSICPHDKICSIYITRCEHYLKKGTGKNWSGVNDLSAV